MMTLTPSRSFTCSIPFQMGFSYNCWAVNNKTSTVSRGPSVTSELLVYIMCWSTSARVAVTAVIQANQFVCINVNCLHKCHITLPWMTITAEYSEVYLSGCSIFLINFTNKALFIKNLSFFTKMCYCRSYLWRCWRRCWWERSWWCMRVTLRLLTAAVVLSTSLASPEVLSVKPSLCCLRSAQIGVWHWLVGHNPRLVTGSDIG